MNNKIFNKEQLDAKRKQYSQDIDKKTMNYQRKYGFKLNPDSKHRTWNVEADAFKHAFMSADITLKTNNFVSWGVGVNHENETPNNPQGEKNMDSWNNNQGRQIADELKKEYGSKLKNMSEKQVDDLIASKVMQRMKTGKLITTPSDKRKYTGFAADIDKDKIYTREEIGKMTPEEFEQNEKVIMKQMNEQGIPTKAEANAKTKASSNSGSKSTDASSVGSSSSGDGNWVTINGHHVLLDN